MKPSARRLGLLLAAAVLVGLPALAWARTLNTMPYPLTSVWPAAVRFLRVDRGFPVHEKDEAAGYILFEWTDGAKPCRGSFELIQVTDGEGRDATRVVITLPDLPKRYEQMLFDKLAARLKEDIGPPAPPPRKPEPTPKPDAGPPASAPPALPHLPVSPAQ